ncbi:MAG: hypothetical protein A2Y98_01780 [Candidatus Portnoybacteria bacterium RBG_19FT_COMBO_36_7]|uniref:Uncharacterized protein n=1 Tax=Candidatus Portnoybacteria bacterium RBG_19FT_COMBO_36_7 TaxID=1801992 RepID=A0A1G2F792_9BACT|nr:MAG: hypothetical protein A2Y98_01780 [Candidatus Portnoybacteria bacterium RBG_19FT_COMBO_36_7]
MKNIHQTNRGFQKILTIMLTVIIASLAIAGGAYAYKIWIVPAMNQPRAEDNSQLIGGQKDEHGCLIAAGYSWCEAKQKCLRTWEEPCVFLSDEQGIRQAFAEKYSKITSDINLNISQNDGAFAKGSVVFGQGGPGEGGYFFAYKKDEKWEIAADGNGSVSCRYLKYYGFPESMTENFCYNSETVNDFSETGNLVVRAGESPASSWVLVYEEAGQPALSVNLFFTQDSFCNFGSGAQPCLEPQFSQGQRARVEGWFSSQGNVMVKDLIIIK